MSTLETFFAKGRLSIHDSAGTLQSFESDREAIEKDAARRARRANREAEKETERKVGGFFSALLVIAIVVTVGKFSLDAINIKLELPEIDWGKALGEVSFIVGALVLPLLAGWIIQKMMDGNGR